MLSGREGARLGVQEAAVVTGRLVVAFVNEQREATVIAYQQRLRLPTNRGWLAAVFVNQQRREAVAAIAYQ